MKSVLVFRDTLTPEQLVERLGLALDGAEVGIWDWDLVRGSVAFDRRWCAMLGLDHATTPMSFATWESRVHPEDLPRAKAAIREHLEGRTARYELIHRLRHEGGAWVHVLTRGCIAARDADGLPTRFTGAHLDVTTNLRAKALLAQRGRVLADLVASLPNGVVMLDRELRILSASARWLADHGLGAVQLGEPLEATLPWMHAHWERALRDALAGIHRACDEEKVATPRGTRWLQWDVRPWMHADASLDAPLSPVPLAARASASVSPTARGVLLTITDVTAHAERRHALERAREERLAMLSLFAGSIAHELNSPLQILLTESELASDVASSPALRTDALAGVEARAELEESLHALTSTARRAAGIAHALRTLARDARTDLPGEVPLDALVRDAHALLRSRFDASGVRLVVLPSKEPLVALARASETLHAVLVVIAAAHADALEARLLAGEGAAVHGEVEVATVRLDRARSNDATRTSDSASEGPSAGASEGASAWVGIACTGRRGRSLEGAHLAFAVSFLERQGGELLVEEHPDGRVTRTLLLPASRGARVRGDGDGDGDRGAP